MNNNRKIALIVLAGLLWVSLLGMACNLPEVIVESIDQPLAGEEPSITQAAASAEPAQATLAPTTLPIVSPASCLAGTWEISDIHEYVLAAIPPEMVQEYDLEYTGTNGSAFFILSPDGRVQMLADGLELLFEASASIFTVPVTARIDGEAVGRYTADGSILTTSNMDTSGLSASAEAMGQQLLSAEQIIRTIPMLEPPANRAQYTCTGNTLTLKVSAYPESVPPLVFNRR